jgi:hypothetical protein
MQEVRMINLNEKNVECKKSIKWKEFRMNKKLKYENVLRISLHAMNQRGIKKLNFLKILAIFN